MLKLDDIDKHVKKIVENMEVIVYKPIGMTPKEIVDIILKKTGVKKGCFVGRLDPIAFGAQHILLDEKCKLANKLYERNKTYRFKIIFGLETSSLDLLGEPVIFKHETIYSSYRVSNKHGLVNPLWWWAKNDRIDEIEIPKIKKELYEYNLGLLDTIRFCDLQKTSINRIDSINRSNDFNQDYLINSWQNLEYINEFFQILEIYVKVSSGFYIRQLVADIGKYLNIKTTTFEI